MNTRRRARELAEDLFHRSPCKIQVVATLSDHHGIFEWGWNHAGNGSGMHAEEHAILRANKKRLRGAHMTIAGRQRKNGRPVYAKPCQKRCMPLIRKHGISVVECTTKQEGRWEIVPLKTL